MTLRTLLAMLPAAMLPAAMLLAPVVRIQAQTLEPSALIERLKKPTPATIEFRELRFSALLDTPLATSGVLRYLSADHLERLVREPYRERTTIRGESVRVERDGEKLRTFALKRAPELKGLLSAFGALLTGDSGAVANNFEITASGTADRWELRLVPRDARTRERIQELVVTGVEDAPSCLLMSGAKQAMTISMFGTLAQQAPDMNLSSEKLAAVCRGKLDAR